MTILHIDTDGELQISLDQMIGISSAILGISGSGKSNTAAVIVEELLANQLPMTLVDIEGENWGLKERFEVLVVGRSEHSDINCAVEQAARLAELSFSKRLPVILDMSETPEDEMLAFLLAYFTGLWDAARLFRQPYQIVLEEAHEFVPQGVRTPLKAVLTRIALRGRKRGLGTLLISQRSPKVEKDLLTQAKLVFLHRVIHPVDLRVYEDIIPLPAKQVDEMIGQLRTGQAVVLHDNTVTQVTIRRRETFDAGATPILGNVALPELRKIDLSILDELQRQVEPLKRPPLDRAKAPSDEALNAAAARIKALEQTISELRSHITQLGQALPAPIMLPQVVVPESDPEVNDQEKLFADLLALIAKLPHRYSRTILHFLIERESRSYTSKEIARLLDLSVTSVGQGTFELITLNLICREGRGDATQYRAVVSKLLKTEFPKLEGSKLREKLISQLL